MEQLLGGAVMIAVGFALLFYVRPKEGRADILTSDAAGTAAALAVTILLTIGFGLILVDLIAIARN
ncbi:hypothetical protein [Reyranella sp.]|uniref:hypothetical protein n=1 Tax=Reyranella sp. TaxID=1929291 RepID=UPI003BA8E1BE